MKDNIYKLNLHEECSAGRVWTALRVAGGWLYCMYDLDHGGWLPSTFVPWSNEFLHKNNPDESRRPTP